LKVEVRLFSTLTRHLPEGSSNKSAVIEVPEGATLGDVIEHLGIPSNVAHLTIINGHHRRDRGVVLRDGDKVSIFPPVGGGA